MRGASCRCRMSVSCAWSSELRTTTGDVRPSLTNVDDATDRRRSSGNGTTVDEDSDKVDATAASCCCCCCLSFWRFFCFMRRFWNQIFTWTCSDQQNYTVTISSYTLLLL